ncbi:hypothetical protein QQX98_010439 [Neonectria punicea]|uniref:BTB domain-containing protein n=1 Tax=Neonectria punicea TaxID=979145 RepID=A0ABR1GPH7_9HYPO
MKAHVHELFPGGDSTLIISLRRPNEQTIFGPEATVQLELLETKQELEEERQTDEEAKYEAVPEDEPVPEPEIESAAQPEINSQDQPESALEPKVELEPQPDSEFYLIHEATDSPVEEQPAIQLQVSSQHLILASPVFKQMLQGPWKKRSSSTTLSSLISTSEWDSKAFMILLDIIHGHHWDVPKSLDLEMLTKFAVIVDYYQCYEIVDIFVDSWLRDMEGDLPTRHGKTSVMWLCVSWVFSRSDTFDTLAKLALRHQEGSIGSMNLPIGPVLEEIDQKRQKLIALVLSKLDELRESLSKGETGCSFECSCMLLGALMKEMQKLGHLSPPFQGHSITTVMQMMANVRPPLWYAYDAILKKRSKRHMEPIRKEIEEELQSFKLGLECSSRQR